MKVETVVAERTFVITIGEADARALKMIMGCIGGSPDSPLRRVASELYYMLDVSYPDEIYAEYVNANMHVTRVTQPIPEKRA
jgi:hypothetical protein